MAQQQSQQQQGDNSLAPLWITISVFVVVGVIWVTAKYYIVSAIFQIRLFEISIISYFTNALGSLATMIQSLPPSRYKAVGFNEIMSISTQVGNYIRYPVAMLSAAMAVYLYFSNAVLRFKKTHTMKSLLTLEKQNWPQVSPVAYLDLINTPLDQAPWAMSMSPMNFAKQHKLLRVKRKESSEGQLTHRMRPEVTLNKQATRRIFTLQLGPYWTGPEKFPIHIRAIYAFLAARANRDRESADKLNAQIAVSSATDNIDFSGTDQLLKRYKDAPIITRITERHAYMLPVVASLLQLARTDGVLPTADFLWLKPLDRSLWFMLSSVGRQTCFTEVAGPFAHWLAEIEYGKKLMVPMIEEAVKGLEQAIQETIYVPDEEGT